MASEHEFSASATWDGSISTGAGVFHAGELSSTYTYASRWESAPGVNPEELLGAAHAACFSMSLAARLRKLGSDPRRIDTTARVTLAGAPKLEITGIRLEVVADVPGLDSERFVEVADSAKSGCPLSKALSGVPIELAARLRATAAG